jgi:hypothetical protein
MRGVKRGLFVVASLVFVLAASGTAGAVGRSVAAYGNVTCHSGSVKSGTYSGLVIAGFCSVVSGATVTVEHNLAVDPGAVFDAVSVSTVNVHGNVTVGARAIAGFGCSPEINCHALTDDHIGGSLISNGAKATVLEQEIIGGNLTLYRGGGSMNCNLTKLFGGPYFSVIEDSTIGGWVSVKGLRSCWFGMIRTHVSGNATINNNKMGDPDAMEIVTNVIGGNLACWDDSPHPQVGDSQGTPNMVGGKKLGECNAPGL